METISFIIEGFSSAIELHPVGGTIFAILCAILVLAVVVILLWALFTLIDFGLPSKKETSWTILKKHCEEGIDSLRGKTPTRYFLSINMLDAEVLMNVVEADYLALTENVKVKIVYVMGRISRRIGIRKIVL